MNKLVSSLFIFVLLFISASELMAADNIVIKASPVAKVGSGRVVLGDIAEISGPSDTITELKNIYIARAPKPGQYVRLSKQTLLYKIKHTGLDLSSVTLDIPNTINIYPYEKMIDGETIIQNAMEYIKTGGIVSKDDLENIYPIQKLSSFHVPDGTIDYQYEQVKTSSPSMIMINVKILCNGKIYNNKKIRFRIKTAKKNVNPPDDNDSTKSEKKDRSSGRTVNKADRVNAGDPLEISVLRKNILITLTGTAIQSGVPGEYIKVRINETKKILPALLRDKRHASITIK